MPRLTTLCLFKIFETCSKPYKDPLDVIKTEYKICEQRRGTQENVSMECTKMIISWRQIIFRTNMVLQPKHILERYTIYGHVTDELIVPQSGNSSPRKQVGFAYNSKENNAT